MNLNSITNLASVDGTNERLFATTHTRDANNVGTALELDPESAAQLRSTQLTSPEGANSSRCGVSTQYMWTLGTYAYGLSRYELCQRDLNTFASLKSINGSQAEGYQGPICGGTSVIYQGTHSAGSKRDYVMSRLDQASGAYLSGVSVNYNSGWYSIGSSAGKLYSIFSATGSTGYLEELDPNTPNVILRTVTTNVNSGGGMTQQYYGILGGIK